MANSPQVSNNLIFIKLLPKPSCSFILLLFFSLSLSSFSQPDCNVSPTFNCNPTGGGPGGSVFLMSSSTNVDMTFDSFGKYISGITVNGASVLRLVVTEALPDCRWQLHVNVDNGGLAPITEWEQLYAYGGVGPPNPSIDLLQVRVRNACNTSLTGNTFVSINNTGQTIDIVDSPTINNNPVGAGCVPGNNVNRPGSYLTNFGEYSFVIDYRVIPTFTFRPGIYQLTVRYCLTEDI